MEFLRQINQFISDTPLKEINWEKLALLFSGSCFSDMKETIKNPSFHGEGDVFTHTKMVCGELAEMPAFKLLPPVQKTEMFLAALLHDIGKVKTTRIEGGIPVSPHHASTGSLLSREFLWKVCGICGTPEALKIRETVCALIRYHMVPVYLLKGSDPERKAREIASIGELAGDFSWDLLCILAEADIKGRTASDIDAELSQIQLCRMMAEEAGCLAAPYEFPDPFTKHAYLSGRNVHPGQFLFDDTRSEVILLSGLPGTGKDTWIRENMPDLPVISLDDIRKTYSEDNPGKVLQNAQEQARTYLRAGRSFIWNATNLIKETRQMLCGLIERYRAKTRIIYLETDWEIRRFRNMNRADPVPESAVEKMLGKTVLPTPEEACTVEWRCI